MPASTSHEWFQKAISEMSAIVPQPSQEKIWKSALGFGVDPGKLFDRLRRAGVDSVYWRVLPKPVRFSVLDIPKRMIILDLNLQLLNSLNSDDLKHTNAY